MRQREADAPRAADRRDAAAWASAIALLVLVPVGLVSGDGLLYAEQVARGASWNSNHLLLEPLTAAWCRLTAAAGMTRPIVDQMRLASVLAAALSAGLFRWGVARRLAERRGGANWMTAWLVLRAAFAHSIVADEMHMLRMPVLVAFAIGVLRLLERPSRGRALAAGAAIGAAGLLFIADALFALSCAAALAVLHAREREPRRAIIVSGGVLAGAAAVAGVGHVLAWSLLRPGRSLVDWLLTYAGAYGSARVPLLFGIRWTPEGIAEAAARTMYGSANVLVDLAPAVAAARDRGAWGPAATIALLWTAGALVLGFGLARALGRAREDRAARDILVLQWIWWPPVVAFALWWNDSSSQFYLPLALAIAILPAPIARGGRLGTALLGCGAAVLAWNASDVLRRSIRYPRAERIAALEGETAGAGLLVLPGWDEAACLVTLSPSLSGVARIDLAPLAVAAAPADGLAQIETAIASWLAAGGRVELIDLYDVPPSRPPWKALRALGWERSDLHRALGAYPVDASSRRAGPFTVRSIRAAASAPAR